MYFQYYLFPSTVYKSYNTLIGAAILFGPSYDMGYNCSLVKTDQCQFLLFSKTAAHAWFQNWELYMQLCIYCTGGLQTPGHRSEWVGVRPTFKKGISCKF